MILPDLYFLRHGETEWNTVGRMQGWLDSPLTELGTLQAMYQGSVLAELGVTDLATRVSPLGRAMYTARLALPQRPEADLISDDRLKEIFVGSWQGKTRPEMIAERPEVFSGASALGWYDHAPQGEGLAGLEARCRAFLADVDQPTIVVTHGITSRMLRLIALGHDPRDLDAVPGGQGVVHAISNGAARTFGG